MNWFFGIITCLIVLSYPLQVEARSGCFSWPDGVCGCSNGRQLCCDETLSLNCTCYSPPSTIYVPPPAENPVSEGFINVTKSSTKPYYSVSVNWNTSESHQYSIAISRIAGADPGPLTDTSEPRFTFYNVTSGRWYVNMKASVICITTPDVVCP